MTEILTLIVRPTARCNATCSYCYVPDKSGIMNKNLVNVLASRVKEYQAQYPDRRIEILWHGGEPSLMPLSFWEYVEAVFSDADCSRISMRVQSNLLSPDTSIYDWWINKNYKIGTSLDGFYSINAIGRNLSQKRFAVLLKNIEYVKSRAGTLGVISVVSRVHLNYPVEEQLRFFEELGVNVRFNIVDAPKWDYQISYADYFRFLSKVAQVWLSNESSRISIEPIETDVAKIFGDVQSSCDRTFNCYDHILTIDADGSVYLCSRFAGATEWRYGNLLKHALSTFLEHSHQTYSYKLNSIFTNCDHCEWRDLCGGGCKKQRLSETEMARTQFCQAIKKYFSSLIDILETVTNE